MWYSEGKMNPIGGEWMLNSERFLVAINQMQKYMEEQLGTDRHLSFYQLIDLCKKKNPIIREYEQDLKEYAELRNAIVHERVKPGVVIAEPHDSVVQQMEFILHELTQPERVIPRYKRRVFTYQMDEPLTHVLGVIKRYSYTQFPIYNGNGKKFIGLLTHHGIAEWLAHHQDLDLITLNTVRVRDVLAHERTEKNYAVISAQATIYDARDIFIQHLEKGVHRLDAILITEQGRMDEPLLGLITPIDVIKMFSKNGNSENG